jgi:hypothetical protein
MLGETKIKGGLAIASNLKQFGEIVRGKSHLAAILILIILEIRLRVGLRFPKLNCDERVRQSRSVWTAATSALLLELTQAFRFSRILVHAKAPLKRTQSRRSANFLIPFQFAKHHKNPAVPAGT